MADEVMYSNLIQAFSFTFHLFFFFDCNVVVEFSSCLNVFSSFRSTRTMCTEIIHFTPLRKCCLRWDQSIPAQWSWRPSTLPPNAIWESEWPYMFLHACALQMEHASAVSITHPGCCYVLNKPSPYVCLLSVGVDSVAATWR